MLKIDTSDCWLEIGVGQRFTRTLVWHFAKLLRDHPPASRAPIAAEAETIDREARRLANQFIFDMREYFRTTLSDTYEDLENLSPEGIVDVYVQQNLEDFQTEYLRDRLSALSAPGARPVPAPPPAEVATLIAAASHH